MDHQAATREDRVHAIGRRRAWLIWSVAHIWFLVGFRSRLSVAVSWLWSYLTYQRSARLILGPPEAPATGSEARKAA